jgi:hypothetical protein
MEGTSGRPTRSYPQPAPGWQWGSPGGRAFTNVTLLRVSPDRRASALWLHGLSKDMAALELTHIVHLLKGLTSSRGALRLLTFPELAAHAQRLGRRLPLSQQSFQRLLDGITTQPAWMHALQQAQCTKQTLTGVPTLRSLIRAIPPPSKT